ncbi:hypothetical protein TrVE_jg30 [Triparma verrucosa]|uniref:Glutathione transferase n=1 Tax=Triparma verrucosa TaxID=1606542 RepID=A0A9W7KXN5_9STRA|nr:hypothetical protein TrVE_jg30 [Triparma verrucosa]
MGLRLYGHWVSQPARSVLWLLHMKDKAIGRDFDFHKVEPMKGDTRKSSFTDLFPTARSPAIHEPDNNDFKLAEGSAILQYLCEKNNWEDWYPSSDLQSRARVNEYLSSHHTTSRRCTLKVFHPVMMSIMKPEGPAVDYAALEAVSQKEANRFSSSWLQNGPFVGGFEAPTIADLFAYTEFAQIPQMDIFEKYDDDRVEEWLARMRELPHHDDVHRSLFKLTALKRKLGK